MLGKNRVTAILQWSLLDSDEMHFLPCQQKTWEAWIS